jgi:sugar phosphate isomerase/epimerase
VAQIAPGLATAGYEGVEVHPGQLASVGDRVYRDRFLEALRAAGLRVACAYAGVASDSPSAALASARCQMAAALGAELVFLVPPSRRGGTLEELAAQVATVCQAAGRLGLGVAVHNHAGTHVTTVEMALRFLDAVDRPEAGLCLDVAHLSLFEDDVPSAVNRLLPYVSYVHIKDLAAGAREALARLDGESLEGVAPLTPAYTDIGAGALDLRAILDVLASGGYNRWATVEIETLRRPTFLEQARDNAENVTALFRPPGTRPPAP